MFNNAKFADVRLRCNNGQEFYGHKVVLCTMSEYFNCLLDGAMQESKLSVVELQADADVVEYILLFLYSGGEEGVSSSNAAELLRMADMWQIPELVRRCEMYMAEGLTLDNAAFTLQAAMLANAAPWQRCCVTFAIRNLPDRRASKLLSGISGSLLPELPRDHVLRPYWTAPASSGNDTA
eukprot:gnl/TRDRNA2_/TRDRNA2_88088_c0_seq2.p1 gnl/TRDRNA2_/TRDRNA2_88088_c0~~gnl/TRDRNA2_/TRDRNA2_88088_c0_seq2.p1  ORF type:complete len:180 (+),score=28.86 gnl/TRDRNA2_/TRDRNA2_88088_c0_seq2:174-713(+)